MMMSREFNAPYVMLPDGSSAVSLPYGDSRRFCMRVFLPSPQEAGPTAVTREAAAAAALAKDSASLTALRAGLSTSTQVRVLLPRFKARFLRKRLSLLRVASQDANLFSLRRYLLCRLVLISQRCP